MKLMGPLSVESVFDTHTRRQPADPPHIDLDPLDWKILDLLHSNCRISLNSMAQKLKASRSTIHYRIQRLEAEGIIKGYRAYIDATRLGRDYYTCTWIRAKYGPGYYKKVGHKVGQIPGVCAVYFVLGAQDLLVFIKSDTRESFLRKLDQIAAIPGVERTETQVVALVMKEDFGGP